MAEKKRNYRREYDEFHGLPEQIRLRTLRGQARKKMGLRKGDRREVDHKKPLSKGGTNHRNNLRVVKRRTNRKKGTKR